MAARNGPDHALAHGVVFSIANDRSFGKDTPPAQRVLAPQPLFLANRCYADTGLTTADHHVRRRVAAAATAFERATRSLNRPISLDH